MIRHPDAQRLYTVRRILRKVTTNLEQTSSLSGPELQDVQTLAQDCAIQTNALMEKVKAIQST